MTKTSLDKDKIKILLLEGIHPSATEKFQADGYRSLEQGQRVEFEISQSDRGPQADDVRAI